MNNCQYIHHSEEPQLLWASVLEAIESDMGSKVVLWFNHLSLQGIKGDTITLWAPTRFIREWILANYYNKLKEITLAINREITKFDIRVVPTTLTEVAPEELTITNDNNSMLTHALDNNFLFSNFVVGDANRLAYAAAKAVAQDGPKNDLVRGVLYVNGPVGMGKTHLLQSIAHQVKEYKVLYLTAEKFMHHYVRSVKSNSSHLFKDDLRGFDILLIDDLQFICGKAGTQQEFANTLNAVIESGKLMVVSSDRSPYDLNLDLRTTSRLAGGFVVDIRRPSSSLRRSILEAKVSKVSVEINTEVLEFIANNVTSSIRELEAALHKLIASARLSDHSIDLNLTKEILKDCLLANNAEVNIDQIVAAVAGYYGLSTVELVSKSRTPKVVLSRQVAYFLAKQLTESSLQEIGHKIGKRGHAIVIYSMKKLEGRLSSDLSMVQDINKIKELLPVH